MKTKLILAFVLAAAASFSSAAATVIPACSWNHPGRNVFTGDIPNSVDDYKDIPKSTREKLKQRLRDRSFEDVAVITRETVKGKDEYDATITEMHFGANSVCKTVTRNKWKDSHVERGLIYCEDGECLIVPTVCRNVSRIKRILPPSPYDLLPPTGAGPMPAETPIGEGPPVLVPPINMPPNYYNQPLPVSPGYITGGGGFYFPPTTPNVPTWPPTTPTTPTTPVPPDVPVTPDVPVPPVNVPEPSTPLLLALGLIIGVLLRKRK
jgi:hypothetical protein